MSGRSRRLTPLPVTVEDVRRSWVPPRRISPSSSATGSPSYRRASARPSDAASEGEIARLTRLGFTGEVRGHEGEEGGLPPSPRCPTTRPRTARRPGRCTAEGGRPSGAVRLPAASVRQSMCPRPSAVRRRRERPRSASRGHPRRRRLSWPVGATPTLRDELRAFARVQVFGEVFNLAPGRARCSSSCATERRVPCSMWREDFERLGIEALVDGARSSSPAAPTLPGSRTVVAVVLLRGHRRCAWRARATCSPSSAPARRARAEGLFEPQKRLPRPALPRCIGVVTGEGGKARDDVLAGLRRRGWAGRLVWAFAPVQDRHAAPAITARSRTSRRCEEVEVIVVARGGGSLADLFAFCDETLCRTVALLRVPVIASVGHHTDRTLIDDVAAVACSTPTHAAEAAVPVDCAARAGALHAAAARLERHGRRAIVERARALAALARAPADHVARHRARLHQHARELRAGAHRGRAERRAPRAGARARRAAPRRPRWRATRGAAAAPTAPRAARRARDLEGLALALAAHDPQRTLERGYALVEDPRAAGHRRPPARAAPALTLRLPTAGSPIVISPLYLPHPSARFPIPSVSSHITYEIGAHASRSSSAASTPARPACERSSSAGGRRLVEICEGARGCGPGPNSSSTSWSPARGGLAPPPDPPCRPRGCRRGCSPERSASSATSARDPRSASPGVRTSARGARARRSPASRDPGPRDLRVRGGADPSLSPISGWQSSRRIRSAARRTSAPSELPGGTRVRLSSRIAVGQRRSPHAHEVAVHQPAPAGSSARSRRSRSGRSRRRRASTRRP